jgi:hypothetical protein
MRSEGFSLHFYLSGSIALYIYNLETLIYKKKVHIGRLEAAKPDLFESSPTTVKGDRVQRSPGVPGMRLAFFHVPSCTPCVGKIINSSLDIALSCSWSRSNDAGSLLRDQDQDVPEWRCECCCMTPLSSPFSMP